MSQSIFRYNPASYPPIFNEAIGIVDALFDNPDICAALCHPIASRFPKENPQVPDYTEDALVKEVKQTLSLGVEIDDDAKSTNFMEMHPNENVLHVNRKYFDCEFKGHKEQYNRCLLLLIIKLIHEVFYALTTTFYVLQGHIELDEKDVNGKRKFVMATPTNLGKSYGKGRSIIGDNGFAFEEHFTGGRLVSPSKAVTYEDPLIIMLVDKYCLQKHTLYEVKEGNVAAALSWYRAPAKGTVNTALQLYDSSCPVFVPPNKRKRKADENLATDPSRVKHSSEGGGIMEDMEEEDRLVESGLRGAQLTAETEEEEEAEEIDEIDPFERLIYSRNYTTDSGDEVKVV